MYAFIAGSVSWIEDDAVIVQSSGLGLRIRVLPQLISSLTEGAKVELYLHHLVREDSEALVGFTSRDQERLFATLLDVSGVGPKVALALLGTHGAEALRRGLVDGDEKLLATAPGVGRRLAARIILELRDRIARDAAEVDGTPDAPRSAGGSDLAAALRSLGFPPRDARELAALVEADASLRSAPLDERLRAALRERA
ncbi:MAG: Holliday junction ATP-dependent DNA helicase RuvA [Chloroflexi bacterium]|jgi:Holliday junction DNA helicase RuvA|nr:Holliday junction ATP-dependent DNA helicase RuvA [Chloroflexota bacterium]